MRHFFYFLMSLGLLAGQSFGGTRATAVATVVDGLVVSIAVTSGGSGYLTPPGVSFSGVAGSGATAVARLNADHVESVAVGNSGSGYTEGVIVLIDSPPELLRLEVELGPKLRVFGEIGTWNRVEWSAKLGPEARWERLADVVITTNGVEVVDGISGQATRFYRATEAPRPVGPAGYVWITAGAFEMGSPPEESNRDSDEVLHSVRIRPGFWMSDHETTQGEFESVMERNPSYFEGTTLPVDTVTWAEAMEYCQRLTEKEGAEGRIGAGWVYRLPTEAEWEYAYRAGTTGATPGVVDAMAWTANNSENRTHDVRTKQANDWGLYDMGGNVWEWCADWYGDYPTEEITNPLGAVEGSSRVVRGGSWFFDDEDCRAAFRRCFVPGFRFYALGFRPILGRIR